MNMAYFFLKPSGSQYFSVQYPACYECLFHSEQGRECFKFKKTRDLFMFVPLFVVPYLKTPFHSIPPLPSLVVVNSQDST